MTLLGNDLAMGIDTQLIKNQTQNWRKEKSRKEIKQMRVEFIVKHGESNHLPTWHDAPLGSDSRLADELIYGRENKTWNKKVVNK